MQWEKQRHLVEVELICHLKMRLWNVNIFQAIFQRYREQKINLSAHWKNNYQGGVVGEERSKDYVHDILTCKQPGYQQSWM